MDRLSEREAAEFLGVHIETLRRARRGDEGQRIKMVPPPFIRYGHRIFYDRADLLEYIRINRVDPAKQRKGGKNGK